MESQRISREEKVKLYDKLIASYPPAIRKGDTMPYTSLNGNMYSYFTKDDFMALKLPETERIKFIDKYKTTLVQQYGIIQKEYVVIPDSLLINTDELRSYFVMSYQYTGTLKPKASKKKN